jgi:hypothetical protein
MIKQQAQAARPPTGPSVAPRELTIVECLACMHTRLSTILIKKLKKKYLQIINV